ILLRVGFPGVDFLHPPRKGRASLGFLPGPRRGRLSNPADAGAKKQPPRKTTLSTYPIQFSSIARKRGIPLGCVSEGCTTCSKKTCFAASTVANCSCSFDPK